MEPALSSDDSLNRYFDRIVLRLQRHFGYSAEEAASLARRYYVAFRDANYCTPRHIPVQDDDFFFHEGEFSMALRIHYYLGIVGDPDPHKFLEWRTNYLRQ